MSQYKPEMANQYLYSVSNSHVFHQTFMSAVHCENSPSGIVQNNNPLCTHEMILTLRIASSDNNNLTKMLIGTK